MKKECSIGIHKNIKNKRKKKLHRWGGIRNSRCNLLKYYAENRDFAASFTGNRQLLWAYSNFINAPSTWYIGLGRSHSKRSPQTGVIHGDVADKVDGHIFHKHFYSLFFFPTLIQMYRRICLCKYFMRNSPSVRTFTLFYVLRLYMGVYVYIYIKHI